MKELYREMDSRALDSSACSSRGHLQKHTKMREFREIPFESNNNNVKQLSLAHQNQEITINDYCQIVVPDAAVLIEKAFKSYGAGKWSSPVLCDLNMTIPKGSM